MFYEDEVVLKCPECGNVACLDDWDVVLDDPDRLFCNECGEEVVPIDADEEDMF